MNGTRSIRGGIGSVRWETEEGAPRAVLIFVDREIQNSIHWGGEKCEQLAGLCIGFAAAVTIGFSVAAAAENKVVRVATLDWPPYTGKDLPAGGATTEVVRGRLREGRIRHRGGVSSLGNVPSIWPPRALTMSSPISLAIIASIVMASWRVSRWAMALWASPSTRMRLSLGQLAGRHRRPAAESRYGPGLRQHGRFRRKGGYRLHIWRCPRTMTLPI